VPISRFRTLKEAFEDPQLKDRGALSTVDVGGLPYTIPNAPFLTPGSNTRPRTVVSDLNADCEAILGGILGYSAEQIAACAAEGGGHE
jgi:crotonobetainyl-CoA:carnitine CoA-transferase CaiB-like acyl-CoA transferase